MVNNALKLLRGGVRPVVTIEVVTAAIYAFLFEDTETALAVAAFAGPVFGFWFASRQAQRDSGKS